MKFTLSWLKEHLETEATLEKIVDTLTRIGLEVEGVEDPSAKLAGFRVARVLTAAPHFHADKLQVLSIDAGDGPLQVVCGAPNARAGMVGIFGAAGATVPSNGMVLRVATIRGVESNGMMCSATELGEGEGHEGIVELPENAPIGQDFAAYAGLNDPVIDVAVLPNRPDCMGVRGIARDLAAAGVGILKPIIYVPVITSAACPIKIRTEDAEGCPAFFGRTIHGVTNGTAPAWMTRRLNAVGQRSISALVDITNYVMLDLGRPSHAYDLSQLSGTVVARRARDGEKIVALKGAEYTLTSEMTVIADDVQAHDIAGIKGGEHSGCSETTTDILLEVAYFDPERIARTSQALNLTSDARQRFERGVDPAFLDEGLAIITALILEHCGGVASDVVRAGTLLHGSRQITYDPSHVAQLGGTSVSEKEQLRILMSLGFHIAAEGQITPPSWRPDIDGPADIVEEIVRIVGLDAIKSVALPRTEGIAKPTATHLQKIERKVRRTAAARGLNEAITWSFVSEVQAKAFGGGAWTLANPISEELKVMRPTLLAGLLAAAQRNQDRGIASSRLFEIGRCYLPEGEHLTAGVVLAGEKMSRRIVLSSERLELMWRSDKAQSFDAFDGKAEALALLAAAGAPMESLQVMGDAGAHYHPGQSGSLRLGQKTILATFGALHPNTLKVFDLGSAVAACEIYLDAVPMKKASGFMRPAFAPPSLQAVTRDFAFLVSADLAADKLVRGVKSADKEYITNIRLFDRFTGQGVPSGQVSLAIEVTLQPRDKSFTDEELKTIADKIITAAAKLGATLRG